MNSFVAYVHACDKQVLSRLSQRLFVYDISDTAHESWLRHHQLINVIKGPNIYRLRVCICVCMETRKRESLCVCVRVFMSKHIFNKCVTEYMGGGLSLFVNTN